MWVSHFLSHPESNLTQFQTRLASQLDNPRIAVLSYHFGYSIRSPMTDGPVTTTGNYDPATYTQTIAPDYPPQQPWRGQDLVSGMLANFR